MKLEVGGCYSKIFIHCDSDIDKTYLRKDGTIGEAYVGKNEDFWSFKSQQEAQQFLDNWMPDKKLSICDVKYYSTLSELEALDCSIEHWKQNVLDVDNANLGDSYCAICLRAKAERDKEIGSWLNGICCNYCVLNDYKKFNNFNCCQEYRDFIGSRTEENAIAMLNKLVLIRNKKYGIAKQSGNIYEEKKMSNKIVFDDGREVELSKETTDRLRKELIKPEPYKFKAGDIAYYGGRSDPCNWRLIISVNGVLTAIGRFGQIRASEQKDFDNCSYKKADELKNLVT